MKVLFVGEYSNVFTELAKELNKRGIDTFSISDGDMFKNYPADFLLVNKKESKGLITKILRYISYRLGLSGWSTFVKNWHTLKQISQGFDVVQLINPVALTGFGSIPNFIFLKHLKRTNKKVFLSALGDDYYVVEWFKKNDRKSNYYRTSPKKRFLYPGWADMYKYCFFYKALNDYAIRISDAIIPGLVCYRNAYLWTSKVSELVPFPISDIKIGRPLSLQEGDTITIFHGWQKGREARKGNDVFDRVIKRVVDKYKSKVHYEIVQSVPFEEYIKLFSNSHVFIDQLYLEECGYNGLLGLAAGKVVFSGFNESYLTQYPNYNGEIIGIDSSLDEDILFEQFCSLIDNPSLINTISSNALNFVENNYSSKRVADQYLKIWNA